MPKKIGTDFHMVANDIYQAYDEGKKPQEKDLTELYELSKEFVKDYEERKEKVVFLNDEEHEFLVEELGENIEGYKREVRLFDAVLKKIATKKGETNA